MQSFREANVGARLKDFACNLNASGTGALRRWPDGQREKKDRAIIIRLIDRRVSVYTLQ
jgi:hypothetical protein